MCTVVEVFDYRARVGVVLVGGNLYLWAEISKNVKRCILAKVQVLSSAAMSSSLSWVRADSESLMWRSRSGWAVRWP